jgi:hypothetical protein
MLSRKPILVALFLALPSAAVLAKPDHPPFPPSYDLNGDGTFTPEEIQSARTTEFGDIDMNDDGFLSIAEVQAWSDLQQTNAFNKLDADQNGSLSRTEFADAKTGRALRKVKKMFRFGDVNGDGALSLAEFKALRPANDEVIRMFTMLDTDDDDQISQEEYLTVPTPPDQGDRRPGRGGGRPGR